VLDRLRDLGRDREQELDLSLREVARLTRADVQRTFELFPREDRYSEDRLVLLFRQVRETLEARVEMRLRSDHHRRPLGRSGTRDPLAGPHFRAPGHLLDVRPVRRPEHELVATLVVEVDEARVGPERLRDLAGDELQHLLEVECRVDGGDRFRQEPQVPLGGIHEAIVGGPGVTLPVTADVAPGPP
jgi:hypothetical protein